MVQYFVDCEDIMRFVVLGLTNRASLAKTGNINPQVFGPPTDEIF